MNGVVLVSPYLNPAIEDNRDISPVPWMMTLPSITACLLYTSAIDPSLVLYAGVTPGYSGLYQINFTIPADAGTNPEIRVRIGTQVSISSIKLAVE